MMGGLILGGEGKEVTSSLMVRCERRGMNQSMHLLCGVGGTNKKEEGGKMMWGSDDDDG